MTDNKIEENLALLRKPFEPHQIGKLPKPTKRQTEEVRANYKAGIRCKLCGGWHHKDVVHLDYVGHAALTDRMLDVDPNWNWKPLAVNELGLPMFDNNGLLWIELTICGVTRLGVGDAGGKTGGNAVKECIGDALRNAAMRFGAALDLWHKGDLHDNAENQHEDSKITSIQVEILKGKLQECCEKGQKWFLDEYQQPENVESVDFAQIIHTLNLSIEKYQSSDEQFDAGV